MTKAKLLSTAAAAIAIGLLGLAYAVNGTRGTCPGEIVCPLKGHTICADKCPLR